MTKNNQKDGNPAVAVACCCSSGDCGEHCGCCYCCRPPIGLTDPRWKWVTLTKKRHRRDDPPSSTTRPVDRRPTWDPSERTRLTHKLLSSTHSVEGFRLRAPPSLLELDLNSTDTHTKQSVRMVRLVCVSLSNKCLCCLNQRPRRISNSYASLLTLLTTDRLFGSPATSLSGGLLLHTPIGASFSPSCARARGAPYNLSKSRRPVIYI